MLTLFHVIKIFTFLGIGRSMFYTLNYSKFECFFSYPQKSIDCSDTREQGIPTVSWGYNSVVREVLTKYLSICVLIYLYTLFDNVTKHFNRTEIALFRNKNACQNVTRTTQQKNMFSVF